MDHVVAGFQIWARTWKRALVIGLLPWLPWLVFAGIAVYGLLAGMQVKDDFGMGAVVLNLWLAPFADQVLALPVYRAERARQLGLTPGSLDEPRSIGWNLVVALVIGAGWAFGGMFIVTFAVVPFIYVAALVAGAEQRNPWSALVRGIRIAAGLRSEILGFVTGLWAIRVAASVGIVFLIGTDPTSLALAVAVCTLFNLLASGLFASVNVAFYQAMLRRNDSPAAALSRVFE